MYRHHKHLNICGLLKLLFTVQVRLIVQNRYQSIVKIDIKVFIKIIMHKKNVFILGNYVFLANYK